MIEAEEEYRKALKREHGYSIDELKSEEIGFFKQKDYNQRKKKEQVIK